MIQSKNARDELNTIITQRDKTVAYGYVRYIKYGNIDYYPIAFFRNHTQYIDSLKNLDYLYNSGYGSQEIDGVVVFTDNTWLTRWEYNGFEGWEYHEVPSFHSIELDLTPRRIYL